MKITDKEVRYIADLANLRLTDDEVRKYSEDLAEILIQTGGGQGSIPACAGEPKTGGSCDLL